MTAFRVLPHPGGVHKLATGRLGDGALRLISGGPEGIRAWDPVTGVVSAEFEATQWSMNDLVVGRPAGREPVVAVATDSGLEWFDAATGRHCHGPTTDDTIHGLTAAAGIVFGAGHLGPFPIHRWDAATGAMRADLGAHDDHIVAVHAFARPGTTGLVAAAGWSGVIHRWDPATGAEFGEPMAGHDSGVSSIDTVRLLLASADFDGVVRRWDAVTGAPIGDPIAAHPGGTSVLAFDAADGPQLLTSGADNVIRRWDAVTGKALGDVAAGFAPVLMTIGGTVMMAAGGDSVVLRPFEL